MSNLFLVDDHATMRRALRTLLQREPDFLIMDEAVSAEQALEKLEAAASIPDLILIDVSLPGMSGLDLLVEIKRRWPALPCVILSGYDEAIYKEKALGEGAMAYINKHSVLDIVPTIRRALDGGNPL